MCCLSLSVIMATAETSKEYKDSAGNKFVAEIDENGWHKNNPGTAYMDEAGNVLSVRNSVRITRREAILLPVILPRSFLLTATT